MCRDKRWMYNVSPSTINNIKVADNKTVAVKGSGNVDFQIKNSDGIIRKIQVRNVKQKNEESDTESDATNNTITNASSEDDQMFDANSEETKTESDTSEYIPDADTSDEDTMPISNVTLRPRNKPTTYFCHEESPNNFKQLAVPLLKEPQSVEEALSGPMAKEWKDAMNSEFESLLQNNTWTLVTLPENKRVIPCKWVFKMKTNANGEVVRYKARLVIKGFAQKKGIEYNEVFAPVVRHTSIRYLFALAVKYNLYVEQMDAVTAFLQGDIDTEIYMNQPPSYEHGQEVCKLNKSIYGLKQASRQWNLKLTSVLKNIGLKSSSVDPCVYYKKEDGSIVYILIYVDDLLIFYNNKEKGEEIKQQLKSKFNMKSLGPVNHFIGWRIKQNAKRDQIQIDQTA
uniref:Uncharacterized protein n=1 Tax=Heliothis virescens TaxID=7102 RepID=A0A2A4JV98_HELVI